MLFIRDNMLLAQSLGKPLMRSFPEGYPKRTLYPHLVQLLRSKDVKILGFPFSIRRAGLSIPTAANA
jgi:hypothetical protein